VLTRIPVISPIEVTLGPAGVRRLPAPDYEIDALPLVAALGVGTSRDPAIVALEEIETAARISEYHDFSWWEERLELIRTQLEQGQSS
jgi:hypothetical protein